MPDKCGGGTERLDQGKGVGGQGPRPRVAQFEEGQPKAGHRPCQGDDIALAAEQFDGLLKFGCCLGEPGSLAQRFGVAG